MVEKIHQILHSSRAYLHNRSASAMFLGTFLCTISKVQKKAKTPFFFASKEKYYSGFSWSRHFTDFTTEFWTNRGLYINVHSVWYIYNSGPYYSVFVTLIFFWPEYIFLGRFLSSRCARMNLSIPSWLEDSLLLLANHWTRHRRISSRRNLLSLTSSSICRPNNRKGSMPVLLPLQLRYGDISFHFAKFCHPDIPARSASLSTLPC